MESYTETNHKSGFVHHMENTRTVDSDTRRNLSDISNRLTKVNKNHNHDWITIENQDLVNLILESFGDEDKRKILSSVADRSLSFSDILKITGIPKTSGHRKISFLIKTYLLKTELSKTEKNRKKTYRSVFEDVIININKGKPIVEVKFTK